MLPPPPPAAAGVGSAAHGQAVVQAWDMDKSTCNPRWPQHSKPSTPPRPPLPPLSHRRPGADVPAGILYWKPAAEKYENDLEKQNIQKERNYYWVDIITVCKEKQANNEEKMELFYEEHLYLNDEICYILDGRGYSDMGDKEIKWIHIFMEKGDIITLPLGIYHHSTLDENN